MYELNKKSQDEIHDYIDALSFESSTALKMQAIAEISEIKALSLGHEATKDDVYRLYQNIEIIAQANAKRINKGWKFITLHREEIVSIFNNSNHINISSQLYWA